MSLNHGAQAAIVLAAHGSSKDPRINRPMFALADRIQNALPDFHVTPGFLDGQPDIRNVIHDIEQDDVIVIPFMASNGYYTNVVFPKALNKPGKSIHFTDAIGTNPTLAPMANDRLQALLERVVDPTRTEVIVVGHGTRKNRDSCLTTIDLVKRLRDLNPSLTIKFGFIDQNPSLEHIVDNIESDEVIVIPFLMGLGPHTTSDVPSAFGVPDIGESIFDPAFQFPIVSDANPSFSVIMDVPVGTYLELADICVELAVAACERIKRNSQFQIEVPA